MISPAKVLPPAFVAVTVPLAPCTKPEIVVYPYTNEVFSTLFSLSINVSGNSSPISALTGVFSETLFFATVPTFFAPKYAVS